jgi:hypothetical protein
MRSINTLAPAPHQFYRLMPEPVEATGVELQPLPEYLPGYMPRLALINGGTPHAFSVSMPITHEMRTKAGKRMLKVIR